MPFSEQNLTNERGKHFNSRLYWISQRNVTFSFKYTLGFHPIQFQKLWATQDPYFFRSKDLSAQLKREKKKSTSLMAKKNFLHFSGSNWSRNLYNSHEILNFFILQKNLKISKLWVAKNDRFLWLRISAAKSWNSVPLLEM